MDSRFCYNRPLKLFQGAILQILLTLILSLSLAQAYKTQPAESNTKDSHKALREALESVFGDIKSIRQTYSGVWILLEPPQKGEACQNITIRDTTHCVVIYQKQDSYSEAYFFDSVLFRGSKIKVTALHYDHEEIIVFGNPLMVSEKIGAAHKISILTNSYSTLNININYSFILEPIPDTPFVHWYASIDYNGRYDTPQHQALQKNIFIKQEDIQKYNIPIYQLTQEDLQSYQTPYFSKIYLPKELSNPSKSLNTLPQKLAQALQENSIASFISALISLDTSDMAALFRFCIAHYQSFVVALLVVCVLSTLLFWASLFVLSREPKFAKSDTFAHQAQIHTKVAWLSFMYVFVLVFTFVVAFSLCELLCFLIVPYNPDKISYLDAFGEMDFIAVNVLIDRALIAWHIDYNGTYASYMRYSLWFSLILTGIAITGGLYSAPQTKTLANIAKLLNAKEMLPKKRKQVALKATEEMAIASGMPMPRVFILENESHINALCSVENLGKHDECYGIFLTKGATLLPYDELQALVAHQFSTIAHKDIPLNLKALRYSYGMLWIFNCGLGLIVFGGLSSSRSHNSNSGLAFALALIIGLLMIIVGSVGMVFAKIIQATIMRQKILLADISSIQYTRNNALERLLTKISHQQNLQKNLKHTFWQKLLPIKSFMRNPNTRYYAHMFFTDITPHTFSVFATHPSLQKRLEKLKRVTPNI